MSTRIDDVKQAAAEALADNSLIDEYFDALEGNSRRERQQAAAVIAAISKEDPKLIVDNAKQLVDALDRNEAQTRWEALDALTVVCDYDSRVCDKAVDGAEAALFDENSGPLRLSAMRFLCHYGATTENRSEKVWGLIDEAIQCYHGDIEFNEMLLALIDFSSGKLAPEVKEEFAARMKFDADNAKGTLGMRAQQIEENLAK